MVCKISFHEICDHCEHIHYFVFFGREELFNKLVDESNISEIQKVQEGKCDALGHCDQRYNKSYSP